MAVQKSFQGAEVIRLRIGVHIGEVVFEAEDVFGEGVNVAARLEAVARPGEVVISDTAHHSLDGKLAALFEGGEARELKNISRQVALWRWPAKEKAAPAIAAAKQTLPPSADLPSIAVLPFAIMSDDREQEYFADGLVDDIITSLSKLSGLRVIARNSTFIYKGQSIDVAEVAKKLRVQYVLEGSVRKSAERIRISAQLIEAASGSHIWAERYDRAITDVFAVQDEITMILATEMQVKLIEGEQARLRYTTTDNVAAWSHWVQGLAHYRAEVRKDNVEAAGVSWQRALALDPSSAPLNAMLGFIHYVAARFGWWDDTDAALSKAQAHIDRALELDPQDAQAYSVLGMASLIYRNFEEAAKHARHSVRLSPGSADIATFACFTLAFAGHADEAVIQGERAIDLSPNCPPVYLGHLGNAYRLAGKFDEAIAAFKAYHGRHAGFGLADLAIVYQQTGRQALAQEMAEQLMAIRRDFTVENWAKTQYRVDADGLEADIAALCAAGLPMH
jgi:adenylate cyclase